MEETVLRNEILDLLNKIEDLLGEVKQKLEDDARKGSEPNNDY